MVLGDRVKFKIDDVWFEGNIVNIYAVPKDWCLVDIELDTGKIIYGVSSQELYGI